MTSKKYLISLLAISLFLSLSPQSIFASNSIIEENTTQHKDTLWYNRGMICLAIDDYSNAFKFFLNSALQECHTLEDFNSSEAIPGIEGSLISGFGFHLKSVPEEVSYQDRYSAYGLVLTLWEANGEGLNKDSTLGKAMKKIIEPQYNYSRPPHKSDLVHCRLPKAYHQKLLTKAKDWVLED